MQVSVESGEGLERKVTVQVPTDRIDSEVESRLKSLQGRVKIDGFRQGKVPLKVVKQRYGEQVLHEVAGELMQNSFREAITQENLQPAGDPIINAQEIKSGQPLEFTATFEVYPVVELTAINTLEVDKVTADITDADIGGMLETLRSQASSYTEVERAAANGDRVTVDFIGTIDGEAFDGGSAENAPLVLGSGAMIPGFEEQIIGVSKNGEATVKVTFPDDYQAEHLRSKEAAFAVTVKLVEEAGLPELDDEFAKSLGVEDGGIEKLKADVKANMQRELKNRIRADVKGEVFDKMLQANPVDVPSATVRQEAESLREQRNAEQPGGNASVEDFMADAKRRVQLGMLLAEVVKVSDIQVDAEKVRERLELISKDYEDQEEVVRYYQSNPQMLRGLETLVMEDMVVDWIVEQAKINTVEKSFNEIMNPKPAV